MESLAPASELTCSKAGCTNSPKHWSKIPKLFCSCSVHKDDLAQKLRVHEWKDIEVYNKTQEAFNQHISNDKSIYESSRGQNIIIVIGKIGVGKSTLVNFLIRKELEPDGLDLVLQNKKDFEFPISKNAKAGTISPKYTNFGDSYIYDTPGLCDNGGFEKEIVNASFIFKLIQESASTKIIFVCDWNSISMGRGAIDFIHSVQISQNFIPEQVIRNSSILVVAKTFQENVIDQIEEIKTKLDGSGISQEEFQLLNIWLQPDKMAIFTRSRSNEERDSITSKINNINGLCGFTANVSGVFIAKASKDNLREIYYMELYRAIQVVMKNYNAKRILNSKQSKKAIDYLKEKFIQEIWDKYVSSPLISFLNPFADKVFKNEIDIYLEDCSQSNVTEEEKHCSELNRKENLRIFGGVVGAVGAVGAVGVAAAAIFTGVFGGQALVTVSIGARVLNVAKILLIA